MEHPVIRGAQFFPFKGFLPDFYAGIFNENRLIKARLKINERTLVSHQTNNLRLQFVRQTKRILSDGISSLHLLSEALKEGDIPDNFGKHIVNLLGDIDIVADTIFRKSADIKLTDSPDEFGGYQILSMIEQSPDFDNRVVLGDSQDVLGLNRVKIQWKISDSDRSNMWKSLSILTQDKTLADHGRIKLLQEREPRIWESQLGFSQHHMGTTRMSSNIREGVVDSTLKVFGTRNFYIGGSSTFPTGGHVPPTLTIVALMLRLADEIKALII